MVNSSPSPSTAGAAALAQLAERLSADPAYMASVLATFQIQERLDVAGLAKLLSISMEGLTRLALCKRPLSDRPEFANQVRQVAAFAGVEPATLAQFIRQVEAVEAAKGLAAPVAGEAAAPLAGPMRLGWLAAARDRDGADDHPGHEQPEGPSDSEPEQ